MALVVAQPGLAAAELNALPPVGCSGADAGAYLRSTAAAVLRMPPGRKGRYAPLQALLPHVGARWSLGQEPRLVGQLLAAMSNDMVASSATACFTALLAQLRAEGGSGGHQDGSGVPAGSWYDGLLPPVAAALAGDDERLRTYVACHGLHALLTSQPGLLRPLLALLLAPGGRSASVAPSSPHARMAGLVAALRAARQLQLLGDLADADELAAALGDGSGAHPSQALTSADGSGVQRLLLGCVDSASEALRLAVLDLACVNPR